MITVNTQEELEAFIVDDTIVIDDDLTIKCYINLPEISIKAYDIKAMKFEARNIEAGDINVWNIEARNIDARNIDAWNIDAFNIKANIISYYAYAIATESLICKSIVGKRQNSVGKRQNSFHTCLGKEIEFI